MGRMGKTTRVENRDETTTGERTRGKHLWGETSCYRCSEMSGILFRDTKVSWGVCTRRVRLEEGLTNIEVIKHTLIPVHSKKACEKRDSS